MKFTCIKGSELTEDHIAQWHALLSCNTTLASPYFHPEFTMAVARIRGDVYITVIEENGKIAGFFPFQSSVTGFGRPVGGILSDYHGIIARKDLPIELTALLKASGIVTWKFDHLPLEQELFWPYTEYASFSPIVDLSRGWDAYCDDLDASGSQVLKKNEYSMRKLQKDLGVVSISHTVDSCEVLDALLQWKSAQYARSQLADIFEKKWTRALLMTLLERESPDFHGVLSELRVGGRVIAAHFGMRTNTTWHWWFPSYDIAFAKYSPGMLLLLDAIREACKLGVTVLDLGKGRADYKMRMSNGFIPLLGGEVCLSSLRVLARDGMENVKNRLRESAMYPFLRRPLQWAGRIERRMRIR